MNSLSLAFGHALGKIASTAVIFVNIFLRGGQGKWAVNFPVRLLFVSKSLVSLLLEMHIFKG